MCSQDSSMCGLVQSGKIFSAPSVSHSPRASQRRCSRSLLSIWTTNVLHGFFPTEDFQLTFLFLALLIFIILQFFPPNFSILPSISWVFLLPGDLPEQLYLITPTWTASLGLLCGCSCTVFLSGSKCFLNTTFFYFFGLFILFAQTHT